MQYCHISMGNTASPSSAKVTSLPSKIPFPLHSNQNVRQGYRRLKWGQQGTLLKKVSILSRRLFSTSARARQRQTPDQTPAVQAVLLPPGKICHHSTKGGVCHQIPDAGVQAMLLERFAIRVEIHSTKGEPASPAEYQLRSDSGKSHQGSDIRNGT